MSFMSNSLKYWGDCATTDGQHPVSRKPKSVVGSTPLFVGGNYQPGVPCTPFPPKAELPSSCSQVCSWLCDYGVQENKFQMCQLPVPSL